MVSIKKFPYQVVDGDVIETDYGNKIVDYVRPHGLRHTYMITFKDETRMSCRSWITVTVLKGSDG